MASTVGTDGVLPPNRRTTSLEAVDTVTRGIEETRAVIDKLKPGLLAIPQGVRERIYGHVVAAPKPIDLTNRPRKWQPALLRTCCQIRNKAFVFYLAKTYFTFQTRDCYAADIIAFSKIAGKYASGTSVDIAVKVIESSCVIWDRLFVWLKAYHARPDIVPELKLEDGTARAKAVSEAFAMPNKMGDLAWMELKPVLLGLKDKVLAIEPDSDEYSDEDIDYSDGGDWQDYGTKGEFMSTHDEDVWVNDY